MDKFPLLIGLFAGFVAGFFLGMIWATPPSTVVQKKQLEREKQAVAVMIEALRAYDRVVLGTNWPVAKP